MPKILPRGLWMTPKAKTLTHHKDDKILYKMHWYFPLESVDDHALYDREWNYPDFHHLVCCHHKLAIRILKEAYFRNIVGHCQNS